MNYKSAKALLELWDANVACGNWPSSNQAAILAGIALLKRCNLLEAENAKLREYIAHKCECQTQLLYPGCCDCGLDDLLKDASK